MPVSMAETKVTASVLHGARDLRLEERTLSAPAAGEVQVAVRATGLCGSDLHYFNHYRNGDIQVREPLTLGHESSGVVTAVGPGVPAGAAAALRPGDRVALEVGLPCGECALCAEGRYNICRAMKFRSSAKAFPHAQGTLQDRINHPAKWCHKLPENVSAEYGALVEPLSVAMHARDRASLAPNSTVLVIGAGAVGLLCAAVCKAARAKAVIIADIQADRVDFAVEHGYADAAIVVPLKRPATVEESLGFANEVAQSVKSVEINGQSGEVDATFECTGVESCLQSAIFATRPGGKIMIIGMGNPVQTLPISAASLREVDLVGVFRYANNYPGAIRLLSEKSTGLPDVGTLITQRFKGMDKIGEAFEMAAKVKDDKGGLVLKVMVDMGDQTESAGHG